MSPIPVDPICHVGLQGCEASFCTYSTGPQTKGNEQQECFLVFMPALSLTMVLFSSVVLSICGSQSGL